MILPAGSSPGSTVTLPDVRVNLHTLQHPATAVVAASESCTAGRKSAAYVRHLAFDVSGSKLVGAFAPGQCFGIIPPGHDAEGKPHKPRLFSTCSPSHGEDGEGRVFATTVKRVVVEHWEHHRLVLGTASNYLCDLQVGDQVAMIGPAGKRFLLPREPQQHIYLFFATGTGIAPFRAMVLELLELGVTNPIVLVAGSPYATDLLYHADFLKLAQEHDNFIYLTANSRHPQHDGHDAMYVHERLRTEEDALLPLLADPRTLIYICGITGMELGIFRELATRLSPAHRQQYFDASSPTLDDVANWSRHTLRHDLRLTGRVFLEVYA